MSLRRDRRRGRCGARAIQVGIAVCLAAAAVPADEAPGSDSISIITDPVARQLRALRESPPGRDRAPLWGWRDADLERRLRVRLETLDLMDAVGARRLGLVLVELESQGPPRVAAVNPDLAMYAASLPKIAILLAAFDRIEAGELELDAETESLLSQMIRRSSNAAATEMIRRVGIENIASVLMSDRYRLYDPRHNGGLWVGKEYAKRGLWRRDPLHNISHLATPIQVARFYYMLENGDLVSPERSRQMKALLAGTKLRHKFAKALLELHPNAQIYRKSGSWRTYHSDSALVNVDGKAYIAVALMNDEYGSYHLGKIIEAFDQFVIEGPDRRLAAPAAN